MAMLKFRGIYLEDFEQLEVKDPDTRYLVFNSDGSVYGEYIGDKLIGTMMEAERVKQLYEENEDTNAFTDLEKAKLAGIEAGAEVNDVTSVNGQTGVVELDAEDVGALPDDTPIPVKLSDLDNDEGFVKESELETVLLDYAEKEEGKSLFSGSYNDLTDRPNIPTKTSDLTNDSGFITEEDLPKTIINLGSVADKETGLDLCVTPGSIYKFTTQDNIIPYLVNVYTIDGSNYIFQAWEEGKAGSNVLFKMSRKYDLTNEEWIDNPAIYISGNAPSTWQYNIGYEMYDLVVYDNLAYYSKQNGNINKIPSSEPTYWGIVDLENVKIIVQGGDEETGKYIKSITVDETDKRKLIVTKGVISSDYIPSSQKGAANGVATLDATGKVPSSQLPSYVDDVEIIYGKVEYITLSTENPRAKFYSGPYTLQDLESQAWEGNKHSIYYSTTDKKLYRCTAAGYEQGDTSTWVQTTVTEIFGSVTYGKYFVVGDKTIRIIDGEPVSVSQFEKYVPDSTDKPLTDFEEDKVYLASDNKTYRWNGYSSMSGEKWGALVVIGSDLALGETASTAYRGDHGKIAYDHSQTPHPVFSFDDDTDTLTITLEE